MTSPDLPTILEEKGRIAKLIVSEDRLASVRNSPKVCRTIGSTTSTALPSLMHCSTLSSVGRPVLVARSRNWKHGSHLPALTFTLYEQCGTGAYPFSTNFAFRSVRASSNVKLATAISFARAAITSWTIN